MTRTAAREIAIQLGFGIAQSGAEPEEALENFFDKEYYATLAGEDELFSEYPGKKQEDYIRTVVLGVLERREELDARIEGHSKGWKLSRISRIAAAILRTAMFEVLYMDEVPDRAAINEAVELAKGYEEPETVAFINGILGSFIRAEKGGDPVSEEPAVEAAEDQDSSEVHEVQESTEASEDEVEAPEEADERPADGE